MYILFSMYSVRTAAANWISVLLKPKVILQGLQAERPKQKLHEDRTVSQYFLVIFMSKLNMTPYYNNKHTKLLYIVSFSLLKVFCSFFLDVDIKTTVMTGHLKPGNCLWHPENSILAQRRALSQTQSQRCITTANTHFVNN